MKDFIISHWHYIDLPLPSFGDYWWIVLIVVVVIGFPLVVSLVTFTGSLLKALLILLKGIPLFLKILFNTVIFIIKLPFKLLKWLLTPYRKSPSITDELDLKGEL